MTPKWVIEVRSDLAVIGHNPEMADMDHPNGEVVGDCYYMFATDAQGYTRQWGWFHTIQECEDQFVLVAPAIEDWPSSRPQYGSVAWVESKQDEQDAWSERRAYDTPAGFEAGPFHRVY